MKIDEKEPLTLTERRVILAMGKHKGSMILSDIWTEVKHTSMSGKRSYDALKVLEGMGLLTSELPDNSWSRSGYEPDREYRFTTKGREAYKLINRVERARHKIEQLLKE